MSDFHHTPQWQRARAAVKRHYKGLCANPFGLHSFAGMITPNGQPTAANVIHHIIPVEIAPNLTTEATNLIPLCNDCHELAHALLRANIAEYRRAFKIQNNTKLTSDAKQTKDAITRTQCQQTPSGEWICARTNRIRDRQCACCQSQRQGGSKSQKPQQNHLTEFGFS